MQSASAQPSAASLLTLHPLYPNRYVWFVFLSAMDVFMTFLVLFFGGSEANSLANWVLERYGLAGMTLYKFALITFVIAVCEIVGRLSDRAGRLLINAGIIVTCIPVTLAFALLFVHL
jgi:hypothetical protein